MKKIISLFVLLLGLAMPVLSEEVLPKDVCIKNTNTLGLYQASNKIVLYKDADETSEVVQSIKWNKSSVVPEYLTFKDLFVLYMPAKSLALMAVTDETEDWVEVIYNNSTGDRAWLKKDDPYKFSNWITFFNMYGRKYGLKILKGAPDNIKDLRAATDDTSQVVARINIPTRINLNVIRGNWALVSVMDLDKTPKTGYIRWRSDDGEKYLFPDIK